MPVTDLKVVNNNFHIKFQDYSQQEKRALAGPRLPHFSFIVEPDMAVSDTGGLSRRGSMADTIRSS